MHSSLRDIFLAPVNYGNGNKIAGSVDDLVKLSFFTEIGKAIASAESLKNILDEVADKIGTIFAPTSWSMLLVDTKTEDLVFKIVVGKNAAELKDARVKKGEGIAGWIAETGQSVIVEDVKQDERFAQRFDAKSGFQTKSIIGVPLKTERRVFGVIELINSTKERKFTPFDIKLLATIADFAAIAVEKVYYYDVYRRLATMDPLTGVYNRRHFEQMLSLEIDNVTRYGHPLSLLMVDIDDFKQINDRFGHMAGDKVLKRAAQILTENVRKVDTVARFGGDEFIVLLPHADVVAAQAVRERIMTSLKEVNDQQQLIPFGLSVGLHSAKDGSTDEILAEVDMDLYREKGKKSERETETLEHAFQGFIENGIDEMT